MADQKKQLDAETEVWNAISAFEQILEAMPEDRLALETLQEAYEKIGDQAQALNYLIRLAKVMLQEGDTAGAINLQKKLTALGAKNPAAREILDTLAQLQGGGSSAAPAAAPAAEGRTRSSARRLDISNEMSLAWELAQANEITKDEYTEIVHDLTENSTKALNSPVSVLHVLEDRQYKNRPRILTYMAKSSGIPLITLVSFELQAAAYSLIPMDVMARQGAIAFDQMSKDLLVAILNPFDKDLQENIKALTGRNCHFYLVSAADFETALDKIRKASAEADKKDAAAAAKK
ncbi:MAG: hypothetical protein AB7T27_11640 [Kiritimatiellia bacterium]